MSFAIRPHNLMPEYVRYLGIDPGLNRTGYAVVERTPSGPRLREGGIIQSTPKATLQKRVHEIGTGLRELLEEFQPGIVAIEQIFSHTQNVKTALLLAHARGAILMAVADAGLPVVHYSATQIKRLLTGSGRAGKEQVQHAVKAELRLSCLPEPNDVADASAVALCLYHSVKIAA